MATGYNAWGQTDVSSWTNIRQPNCLEPFTTIDYLNQTATNIQNAAYIGSGKQQNALLDKINTAISAVQATPPDNELAILALNDFYKIICNMKKQGKIDENTYNTLYNDYVNILKSIGQTPKQPC
ncbi:MAG: hypothetical protein HZB79_01490 [Deltaproteobacteria bacterium]|nr:hypothetical protein [Deltaproteobacteria bacterium]